MWNNSRANDMGGGYLNSPGGYGSSQQASQSSKSFNKMVNHVPCTIKQIMSAEVIEDNIVYEGVALNQITLVGVIRSAKESSTNLAYEIDDMSGMLLEVRQFGDNDENTPEAERVAMLKEGQYVRVHGHLRIFNGKRSVVAFRIFPLSNLNDLTTHILENLYSRAYAKQSHQKGSNAMRVSGGLGMPQQSGSMFSGHTSMAVDPSLTKEQSQILNILRSCTDETGVSVQTVCNMMRGVPERAIRDAMDHLGAEGHVYSTIDDDHYKATDA